MQCPYCGSTHFDEPKSILTGDIPEVIRNKVPMIAQCLNCQSTFAVKTLTDPVAWAAQADLCRHPVFAATAAA